MIALVDYGAGNLTSVRKALSALNAEVVIPSSPETLASVAGIIVPGVGHFDRTRAIDAEWRRAVRGAVERGAALFGICLGMQWLFAGSDEAPGLEGLAVFEGNCVRLGATEPADAGRLKVPHVGWNSLERGRASAIMHDVPEHAQVYFTHSYAAPVVAAAAAVTTHGTTFTSVVQAGRVAGVQFHPEKSGDVGLRILKNWLDAL